ncbi:unnamed protein product [Urochloa decumbens]|uniref:F-box domain-containing protein n=1 Tax=Urochloa decumbens TaxID=240449 RepID=A0ABC8YSR1_9POAL
MTGCRKRRQQHRRGNPRRGPPIHKVGEDLLLEIFLCLPSLATLVCATLTCRAWRRAVASSPSFCRRFREIHPAPLLGLFFYAPGPVQTPNTPGFPTFIPARRRDTIHGGDFFLTFLDDLPYQGSCWDIVDCCCGCVLLMNWDDSSFAVFNPLTRRSEDVFDLGSEDIFDDSRGTRAMVNPRLLFSDEDPNSFRVVLLAHDERRVQATVFSSDSREWLVLPWVDVPVSSSDANCLIQCDGGMQANRFLYWVYRDQRYLLSLDTATMEFYVTKLPRCLRRLRYSSFDAGETKDGATCIVYSDRVSTGVLMHTRDDDGVEKWVRDRVVPLDKELERALRIGLDHGTVLNHLVDNPDLFVFAIRDDYAYLSASGVDQDSQNPCWFMSLSLETMKLERLFRRTLGDPVHPYIMAWPSSLVGNYGRFALEDAPDP